MGAPADVEAWLATLDAETRTAIDALRRIVQAAHPGLAEEIKWNAPSFSLEGADRVTLGVERKGGVRMVLHRGAKASPDFAFTDDTGLARWPSPDRGVLLFRDAADADAKAAALTDLVRRWAAATG